MIGKYIAVPDAYKSITEALMHAGVAQNAKIDISWLDAEEMTDEDLSQVDGILVPGGFGQRGAEGKMRAVTFARENNVPYFGICLGMQMAVLEVARNVAGLEGAGSTEFGPCDHPIISLMTEWQHGDKIEQRVQTGDLGGTMRLGAYPCKLKEGSKVRKIYGEELIHERHRHRYEINLDYHTNLEVAGMEFVGLSPDGELPEIVELKDHPWFVGVQFHPEFQSKPFDPHPLFVSFIEASMKNRG